MKHSVVMADVTKNKLESPLKPTVPGPAASANTFTKENEPLINPNPKPATDVRYKKENKLSSSSNMEIEKTH